MGERSLGGDLGLEAGLRFDRVEHDPAHGGSRDFTGGSASLGLIVPLGAGWQATLLGDYSSRAPVGEELFSDGPHLATRSFEIGDPGLDQEQARNLAATLSGRGDRWSANGTFYYTSFADFIYQAATGEEEDGLDVRQFSQADATFVGFEVEGRVTVAEWGAGRLELGAFFDMVSPELDVSGNDNLPLIPPDRVGVSVAFTNDRLRANVNYVRASEQDDVADFELPTDSYDDLRARIAWRFRPGDMTLDLFVARPQPDRRRTAAAHVDRQGPGARARTHGRGGHAHALLAGDSRDGSPGRGGVTAPPRVDTALSGPASGACTVPPRAFMIRSERRDRRENA